MILCFCEELPLLYHVTLSSTERSGHFCILTLPEKAHPVGKLAPTQRNLCPLPEESSFWNIFV